MDGFLQPLLLKKYMRHRSTVLYILCSTYSIDGQPSPSKEYVHFASKVVAIEVGAGTSPPSGNVAIRVWPGTASLSGGQTLQLNPVLTGTANLSVNWTVFPAVG